jgi:hypothetical protein
MMRFRPGLALDATGTLDWRLSSLLPNSVLTESVVFDSEPPTLLLCYLMQL